jgi:hypothetical protein
MFCKRMAAITTKAKERLEALRERLGAARRTHTTTQGGQRCVR